jgi:hypothetical protein
MRVRFKYSMIIIMIIREVLKFKKTTILGLWRYHHHLNKAKELFSRVLILALIMEGIPKTKQETE